MSCLPLELTLVSAHGLKNVNLVTKMDVYAVVTIDGDQHSQKRKTPVDKECGTDPRWNYTMILTMDEEAAIQNRLVLEIKIKSQRNLGDKDIGQVHVPVKELLDGYGGDGANSSQKIVSYSVRTTSGKAKGILDMGYKFREKFTPPIHEMKSMMGDPTIAYPFRQPRGYPAQSYPPATAYPPRQYPPPGRYPSQPPVAGYGYPPSQPQPGYGYGYPSAVQPHNPRSGFGGIGMGLGAGLLGGLLIGEMVEGVSDASAYSAGYDAGYGDGGGFNF